MKYLFAAILLILIAAAAVTAWMMPESRTDVPVLYWVTDANPARIEQINRFHHWLVKKGYTKPGDPTRPIMEIRVDSANGDSSKVVIQGVSGVGGDVIDVHSAGGAMMYYCDIGLLEDITEQGLKLGFDPTHTWPAIAEDIVIRGEDGKRHQYMYPCNVYTKLLWVNNATLRKYGVERLPERWTFDEFERIGKQFVQTANRGKVNPDVFFADGADLMMMRRSLGLDTFNETLTRCILDDPRNVEMMNLRHKWTYVDRIIPSSADIQSFSTAAGYGGGAMQLFGSGNYALYGCGRYGLIQFRQFGQMDLSVVELPHGGFPNTITGTRAAAVYKGGKHKDLAVLFVAFLASEDYNMQIVEDADALPPNPQYAQTPEFTQPAKYPNEWDCHEKFSKGQSIAIPTAHSPFVSPQVVSTIIRNQEDAFMSNVIPAGEAGQKMQRLINEEIARRLAEEPRLQERYQKLCETQRQIDRRVEAWRQVEALEAQGQPVSPELREQAKKIPLDWIGNVFYRRYYKAKGWAE